jgi:hypothetical protein
MDTDEKANNVFPLPNPTERKGRGRAKIKAKVGNNGNGKDTEAQIDADADATNARNEKINDALIDEINKDFAIIPVGGKVVILREHTGKNKDEFVLWGVDSLKLWMANQQWVSVGKPDADGKQKSPPVDKFWIQHPRRRQYPHEMVFSPNAEMGNTYYNLWTGFAFKPDSTKGSCAKFLKHILDNVAARNEDRFNYIIGWFAQKFQKPRMKVTVCLALRGDEGVGNSIVGEVFGKLLGKHYIQVADPQYVMGRFNSHMVSCLLLQADEAFWAGDKKSEGKLKDLITGKRHPIEFKGKDTIFIENLIDLFITRNQNWVMPVAMGDRRTAMFDVLDTHKEDHPYFDAIMKEMEDGGYEALLDYLLKFDLTKVNLWDIPNTQARLDQKKESLCPEDKWWLDFLEAGELPSGCVGDGTETTCTKDSIIESYVEHAKRRGVSHRSSATKLGQHLMQRVPGLRGSRPGEGKERVRVWTFPPLKECRAAFAKAIRQELTWDDPEGEWEKTNKDGTVLIKPEKTKKHQNTNLEGFK